MQQETMNNCLVRSILSGVGGGVMGVGFGVFFGSMEGSGGGVYSVCVLVPIFISHMLRMFHYWRLLTKLSITYPSTTPQPMVIDEKKTARQVLKEMAQNIGSKSLSYAKGFAVVGLLFAGSECIVEKTRAKHDLRNSLYAGCFSGAALAYKTGPRGMCTGCAGFAAFSVLIDKIMEH